MGLLLRDLQLPKKSCKENTYKAFVKPQIEYAATVGGILSL